MGNSLQVTISKVEVKLTPTMDQGRLWISELPRGLVPDCLTVGPWFFQRAFDFMSSYVSILYYNISNILPQVPAPPTFGPTARHNISLDYDGTKKYKKIYQHNQKVL